MRTTVTLDENLVRELVRFSGAKSKTAAVAQAVKEQIRRAKLKKLAGLLGTVDIDEKAIEEGNKADMERAQWLQEMGAGNDA
ncbi:MAG: type II toxin-antitoxin system VapB family antitoxin [Deltaproteobacteria bacterium]|nr:type II toxin-antitoxin system VapB family antitoxin [Deltaproteobacteria bacterium]MBW2285912.1 type II toxin-antitoxin system VapB family antitoxin [Deltaproteobacteria bacterium]